MTAHKKQRVYWDSCAFISIFKNESGRADVCAAIFRDADAGKIELYPSTLVIAECSGGVAELSQMDSDRFTARTELVRAFFENRVLRFVQLDRRLMERAASLIQWRGRMGESLPTKDAIHLACSIWAEADVLHTYDRRHLIRLHNLTPPGQRRALNITEPTATWNLPLPGVD